jgi:hypothetical protein
MKLFKYTALLLAGIALLFSCAPEGYTGLDGGYAFHERNIVSIAFERQIGDAVIETVSDSTGTVEVRLAVDMIQDLSQVTLTSLVVAYGATATAAKDDKIDFSGGSTPTISVTSQAGEKRVYSINMIPFVESFAGNYAINGSYILGGLGEATSAEPWSWGVLLLATPESKSWCWAKWAALGYGPSANYDNYLEITCTKINDDGTTEGTCINYGGVDGKHWNCLLDGAQNKEKDGQDLDLHNFYRVIPIGESTWKKDYALGTITFKDASGKERVCSIFDSDITICEGAGKKVVVENQCLAFSVPGDTRWDATTTPRLNPILYTDYMKFVVAPRYYFLLVTKVDEIPAASKVVGDEGDVNIDIIPDDPGSGDDPGTGTGDDPGTTPDLSAIAGEYKVNSLKILGGGRSGFDEIKLKPWDWTGYVDNYSPTNADKEYDNILTVTVDGTSGTLNYGPGADGEYWDYTYKNNMNGTNNDYGDITVDMSFNFGQLPHGESTFTLDPQTMVATIKGSGSTVYGMVYGSGTHTDSATSVSLVVPSNCIAIAFQLKAYDGTDYTYEDRMSNSDLNMIVFHPNYYVMIFQKQ